MLDLTLLQTESSNPKTAHIDTLSALEICRLINNEDASVANAVEACLPIIAEVVTAISERVGRGGRVIYVGAGTSGRLGVLDASEIPPTFSAPPEQFVAIMAGGDVAIRSAVEGAEDNVASGVKDLKDLLPPLKPELDTVIGIAASGRTPYVIAGLSYARNLGCLAVGISCVHPSEMHSVADFVIAPVTGPEVVTGSTRMKAGTATKMVLNMISTGVMIKIGKTYGNMMVDVKASNVKLKQRARNIVRSILPQTKALPDRDLDAVIDHSNGSVKLAILLLESNSRKDNCQRVLANAQGNLSTALKMCDAENRLEGLNVDIPDTSDTMNFLVYEEEPTITNGFDFDEELAICIDAGGSKCCVAISDFRGNTSTARAGPCNYTSVGQKKALEIISEATQLALGKLAIAYPKHPNYSFLKTGGEEKESLIIPRFRIVNVGIAGINRTGAVDELTPALLRLFDVPISALTVSNDVDFLTFTIRAKHPHITEVVVLIAGTGSIAMSYSLCSETGKIMRKRRAGGWGSLLGDDGSGFEIGKQGIRSTLIALENELPNFGAMQQMIMRHFGVEKLSESGFDLLSKVYQSTGDDQVRMAVAEAARIVVDAMDVDVVAAKIVNDAVEGLVRMVKAVMPVTQKPALVLSGGLMKSQAYQAKLYEKLSEARMEFEIVESVDEPALEVVKLLGS